MVNLYCFLHKDLFFLDLVWLFMQSSVISEFLFRNFQSDATGKENLLWKKKWCLNLVDGFTFPNGSILTGAGLFPTPAGTLESARVFPHLMNFPVIDDAVGCGRRCPPPVPSGACACERQ